MRLGRGRAGLLIASAVIALGASVIVASAPGGSVREGGTFKIAGALDAIDPAVALGESAYVLEATCAQLMNHPDKGSPAGTRAVPEVAAAYPTVSGGGKTYTFTIRSGFRFSTGEKVTAASFAHAVNRVLSPTMKSPSVQSVLDIVGAQAVLDGKATEASGIKARGKKLIVRLKRAAGDFPSRVTQFQFCAVPEDLPVDPEGVGAPFPSAGPYYISEFVPGERFVLERNPYYRGSRPHHVDKFEGTAVPDSVAAIKNGEADFSDLGPIDLAGLESEYRPQLHLVPGAGLRTVVLNSSRPLFKDNAALRQAVNFAIERRALIRARGANSGVPTDQYLLPSIPGFVDANVYPLDRPNLAKAKALAKRQARSGTATLYIQDRPDQIAQAQILERDLKPLGIVVKTRKFPGPALFQRLFTPGTPWDMTLLGIGVSSYDPYELLNLLFDGRLIGTPVSSNLAHFDSPKYNALLTSASRLTGTARNRAYGRLDVDLARNAAPVVSYLSENASTFVSKRVGCLVLRPWLDLAAVCLK